MRQTDTTSEQTPFSTNRGSLAYRPSSAASPCSDAVIDDLVETAVRAGIDLDREAAREWLRAVADASATPGEYARSLDGQFGGHELALIDFDPDAASRLREIGRLIATPTVGDVTSALAIAGSAAQGRIQPFPADA